MFEPEILLNQIGAMAQPVFKLACRLDDVHARNNSEHAGGKSNLSRNKKARPSRDFDGPDSAVFRQGPWFVNLFLYVVGDVPFGELLLGLRHIFPGVDRIRSARWNGSAGSRPSLRDRHTFG